MSNQIENNVETTINYDRNNAVTINVNGLTFYTNSKMKDGETRTLYLPVHTYLKDESIPNDSWKLTNINKAGQIYVHAKGINMFQVQNPEHLRVLQEHSKNGNTLEVVRRQTLSLVVEVEAEDIDGKLHYNVTLKEDIIHVSRFKYTAKYIGNTSVSLGDEEIPEVDNVKDKMLNNSSYEAVFAKGINVYGAARFFQAKISLLESKPIDIDEMIAAKGILDTYVDTLLYAEEALTETVDRKKRIASFRKKHSL